MRYEIVPYAPELDPQVVRLQGHFFGDAARAYLHWKYAENPFLDETVMVLAVCDGRVAAMRGMFGASWQVDDAASRHLLPCADDFLIDPEHRNRGMASLILRATADDAARRGFRFALSLSAGAVTFVTSLAAGWRAAGSYGAVVRSQGPSELEAWVRGVGRRSRWRAGLRPLADRMRQWLWGAGWRGPFARLDRAPSRAGHISLSREPRPREMAALIERLPWDGRIRHVRDEAYLAWRFRNPMHEYRFVSWDDGGLQGYLVLQSSTWERADQELVNIADWEAADKRIAGELLRFALDRGRFPRVQAWSVGAAAPLRSLLHAHGFNASETGGVRARSSGLLVRQLAPANGDERWTLGSRDLLEIGDWDLRMLYSMSA